VRGPRTATEGAQQQKAKMSDNRKFWEEQGEAWKPMDAKSMKKTDKLKKKPNLEEGVEEDSPLVKPVRRGNWRNHFVNGHVFTVVMATFAVCFIAGVLLGAAMLVSGTAKEVQELAPAPKDWEKKAYGSKHEGVGFANYVVGNAVSNFWQKEMGKKGAAKMTDPFASFLLKKKTSGATGGSNGESPEQQADDAQPVDEQHGRIAGARATTRAIKHAREVARYHRGRSAHSAKNTQ